LITANMMKGMRDEFEKISNVAQGYGGGGNVTNAAANANAAATAKANAANAKGNQSGLRRIATGLQGGSGSKLTSLTSGPVAALQPQRVPAPVQVPQMGA
jgi:hypothetical protein